MFDPARVPDPPAALSLRVDRTDQGLRLSLAPSSEDRPDPAALRYASLFLRVWTIGLTALAIASVAMSIAFFFQAESRRLLALAIGAGFVLATIAMLAMARRGHRQIRRAGGWLLTLTPTRWEGASGSVDPDAVRGVELTDDGRLAATTDKRSVALVSGIAEPQARWLQDSLRRALSLPA